MDALTNQPRVFNKTPIQRNIQKVTKLQEKMFFDQNLSITMKKDHIANLKMERN
jgi:hypothetical protein